MRQRRPSYARLHRTTSRQIASAPLSQRVEPTGHATVTDLFHKFGHLGDIITCCGRSVPLSLVPKVVPAERALARCIVRSLPHGASTAPHCEPALLAEFLQRIADRRLADVG